MADQAERVILEAEDQVTPVVDKANAGLDRFEKQAEASHGKVIRISDQTRSSVQRLIASLEKQADTYGKSGVGRLITQRDQLLQRYTLEPGHRRHHQMLIKDDRQGVEGRARSSRGQGSQGSRRGIAEAVRSHPLVRRA